MSGRLAGKTALITGGASGIGLSIARLFMREGAAVSIVDLGADAIDRAVADLGSAGGRIAGFRASVSDDAALRAAVTAAADRFGTADILVNNAGTACLGTVADTSDTDFERVMLVNVMGTFFASRAVLPAMIDRRSGAIVRIPNAQLTKGAGVSAAYCARRARQVQQEGLIAGFHALLDRSRIGLPLTVFTEVGVEQSSGDMERLFIDAVQQMPNVVACYRILAERISCSKSL